MARVENGSRYLGYRIFPTHRLLPRQNVLRMRRRLAALTRRAVGFIPTVLPQAEDRRRGPASGWPGGSLYVRKSLAGWIGHACHADTWGLRRRLAERMVFTEG